MTNDGESAVCKHLKGKRRNTQKNVVAHNMFPFRKIKTYSIIIIHKKKCAINAKFKEKNEDFSKKALYFLARMW